MSNDFVLAGNFSGSVILLYNVTLTQATSKFERRKYNLPLCPPKKGCSGKFHVSVVVQCIWTSKKWAQFFRASQFRQAHQAHNLLYAFYPRNVQKGMLHV